MNRRTLLASIGAGVGGVGAGWFVLSGRSVGYRVTLEHEAVESDAPLVVETVIEDEQVAPGDPAILSISVTNEGSDAYGLMSGAPAPFGILRATKTGSDRELTLWSDAYDESTHVSTMAEVIVGVNDIGIVTEFEPGDSRSSRYELRRRSLVEGPGTYLVTARYGVELLAETGDEEERTAYGPLLYELRLSVS